MPGLNTSGAPNTRDYILGRGRILLAQLDASTGLPDANGFRDIGNVPEFTMTVDAEDLRHQNSRDCIKFTDKRFIISQEVSLGFQVDELNFQNWSDFLAGSTAVYDNPHDTTWAATASIVTTALKLGNWYELHSDTGARVYDIGAVGVVLDLVQDPSGTPASLASNDYEIDLNLGLVRFVGTGTTSLVDGDIIGFAITTGATTPQDLDEVAALQRSEVSGAMLFISENAGDCGQKAEFRYHQVSLTADGEAAMIGDEVSTMSFAGVAEINNNVTDTSKVLTVRTYDMKA
jgi:hypothetical protein